MISLLLALLLSGCGEERWAVKILQDSEAVLIYPTPVETTVPQLRSIHAPPYSASRGRNETELTTYRIVVYVIGVKLETDGDIHVVVAETPSTKATMIVEFPSAECAPEFATVREKFVRLLGRPPTAKYRKRVKPLRVELVGTAFFDLLHGQVGVAPNGIELHPVLDVGEASYDD